MCAWIDAFTCDARLKSLSVPPEDHQEGVAVGTSSPERRFGINQKQPERVKERDREREKERERGREIRS